VRRIGEPVIVHRWLQLTEQIFPTPTQAVAQYWKHSFKVFVFGVCAFAVCAKVMPDQVMKQNNPSAETSLNIAASLYRDPAIARWRCAGVPRRDAFSIPHTDGTAAVKAASSRRQLES